MFIMSVVLFLSRRWFEKCHLLKYKTLFFISMYEFVFEFE